MARAQRIRANPSDVAGTVLGLAVLAGSAVAARRPGLGPAERRAFRLVNRLPAAVEPPLVVLMQAGALGAVPVAAGAALVAGRPQLARALAGSGAVAWVLAKVVKRAVGRGRPTTLVEEVLLRGRAQSGLGFPSGHAAVSAAMAFAADPHLRRPQRLPMWWWVGSVGAARIYVGAHLPVDVLGGLGLGVAIGGASRRLSA